jgi:hypothetical protein
MVSEAQQARTGQTKHYIVDWLEHRTTELLTEIRGQEFWSAIMCRDADPQLVKNVMKEVYAEIVGYQPYAIEAAIASIAQFPRSVKPILIKAMLAHQADEFDHGEMALRDFVGLGGSETVIRNKRMSAEAFAVSSVWWMITRQRDPFAYLGALYLFEGLTPTVTSLVKDKLRAKGFTSKSLEYVEFHSIEDIKHANLVHHVISKIAQAFPDSIESIKYGFECFSAVYPIPLWRAAFRRATTCANGSH